MTAPNKPGNDVQHNKCHAILLTVIRDLLVYGFAGAFDQNPAVLRINSVLFDLLPACCCKVPLLYID